LGLLRERAADVGVTPAVLTFDPHPIAVLAPDRAPRRLTTIDHRIELLGELGVEVVAVLPFTPDVRAMTAEAFVEEVMCNRLQARLVVAGSDFRFGVGRTGDVALLEQMGPVRGFEFLPGDLVGDGVAFSSTSIRQALAAGDVERAASLLGRHHELAVGDLGWIEAEGVFTSRSTPDATLAIPGPGVYAGRIGGNVAAIVVADGGVEVAVRSRVPVGRVEFVCRLDVGHGSAADHIEAATSACR
jgi:riboflavin kinase/FMN adenylyltransferase